MKLELGMYVRTKDGVITKIIDVEKNPLGEKTIYVLDKEINIGDLEMGNLYLTLNPFSEETTNKIDTHFKDEVIIQKASNNIIDLIEVGDYVNGKLINEIDENRKLLYSYERDDYYIFRDYDVKSIVTSQQFESMQYKVD